MDCRNGGFTHAAQTVLDARVGNAAAGHKRKVFGQRPHTA